MVPGAGLSMNASRSFRIIEAASAAARLEAAASFLRQFPADQPITIVGATRGAADDLARRIAVERGATIGLARFSLTQLAARTAVVALAAEGKTASTSLGAEAVAARAVFAATRDASLRYFTPVAGLPGFPRALARTLQELRLAGIGSDAVRAPSPARADLADLLTRFDTSFAEVAAADRADLLHTAARLLRQQPNHGAVLLLDVPVNDAAEAALVSALTHTAGAVLATVPRADRETATALIEMGGTTERSDERGSDDLASLRRFLFETDIQPPERVTDGSLEFFSAPGEGRECVEIARRVLQEARRGVRFDEMAIFVRSPQSYFGLLEHALRRADVPAWFDRGTRRPHPAGRAFLALLACGAEHLSAARFAEYLSLGQVPQIDGERPEPWAASHDEALGPRASSPGIDTVDASDVAAAESVNPDLAVVAGTLRAPWRWERLLVDAAVIGQDASRWKRRLEGRLGELTVQIDEARRQEGTDSGKVRALELTLEQCDHLSGFAMPIINELAAWPAQATWGEWLDRFERLAPRVLRMPAYVLRVLADLRPMADVGPVDLDEARRVLGDRLLTLDSDPPARRFGRIFVGTPGHARGREFRVVFVPGLAERMFPQKPREDPLLLDDRRSELSESLPTQGDRLVSERLLLQVAAGAASDRLYVSYPRIELTESRARVPSFYALDMMRAVTGSRSRSRMARGARAGRGQRHAGVAGAAAARRRHRRPGARPRRPAPAAGREGRRGRQGSCALPARAERMPEALGRRQVGARAEAMVRERRPDSRLSRHGTRARSHEVDRAFVLGLRAAEVHRLSLSIRAVGDVSPSAARPARAAAADGSADARQHLSRHPGSLLPRAARSRRPARHRREPRHGSPRPRTNHRPGRRAQHDELAPAVERVWADEVASIRRDLQAWLHYLARDGAEWEPTCFEFAFGPVPGERDAASVRDDVTLESGFKLRGAVDLIEEHRQTKVLRVTDHKTGRKPDRIEKMIIGGGAVLQPVLYAMAVERALDAPVSQGRLFYCTSAGSFYEHPIPLNEVTRAAGLEVLRVIDRAIEIGFLAASPGEDACDRCNFVPVCGREVPKRVERKPQDKLADLDELRRRP